MIVEGQIMGGLTEGYAIAAMELITFDDDGNCMGRTHGLPHPDRLGDAGVRARRARRPLRTTRSERRAWASRPRSDRRPPTSTQ